MKKEKIIDCLIEEGYKPTVDTKGRITFKSEGTTCIVITEPDSDFCIIGAYGGISDADKYPEEIIKSIAYEVDRKIKMGKCMFIEKDMELNYVICFFSVEFYATEASLQQFIGKYIGILHNTKRAFLSQCLEFSNKKTV